MSKRSIYNSDGTIKHGVCWGCGSKATTWNGGWPVCRICKEENVGVDGDGSTRSIRRQEDRCPACGEPSP